MAEKNINFLSLFMLISVDAIQVVCEYEFNRATLTNNEEEIMITFNFTEHTAVVASNLIEALEIKLPGLANNHGIISTFCKIDECTYSAVSELMSLIKDGGRESISSVCNAILSGNWSVVSI